MPVVVLTGMRQTGKTTLLQQDPALRGRRYISLDDFGTYEAAKRNPEALVEGDEPVTIDEAQRVPELMRAIKLRVDRGRRPGQYLLSGSANFLLLKGITESLAGRVVYFTLHPMHRREILETTSAPVFLRHMLEHGAPPKQLSPHPFDSQEILRGGMPTVALRHIGDPTIWFQGFEQTYLERDLRDLSQVADLTMFRTLLRLAALRNSQVLNQSELARDAKLTMTTAGRYLSLLETSFLLARLPSYLSHRASRLIKAPKIYFGDSGLAAHLAGVRALSPITDEPLAGALLENYVYQNLAALREAAWPEAELLYWHVQGRYEVDFVIRVGRDNLAVEVKSGSRWSDSDLRGINAFLHSDRHCRAGILAHTGKSVVQLGDRLWAVPIGTMLG
jgi:predicted AAA+ superfamily ATPase